LDFLYFVVNLNCPVQVQYRCRFWCLFRLRIYYFSSPASQVSKCHPRCIRHCRPSVK